MRTIVEDQYVAIIQMGRIMLMSDFVVSYRRTNTVGIVDKATGAYVRSIVQQEYRVGVH